MGGGHSLFVSVDFSISETDPLESDSERRGKSQKSEAVTRAFDT